jgi:uncharacterized protein (TIGR02421 family)
MKISRLPINQIIEKIQNEELFEAQSEDGSFNIKIAKYVPYCCFAIHSGSKLQNGLNSKVLLNEYERWYEEYPFTDSFIKSLPITLIANDSRFEYDLNRSPENSIYTEAWGKKVWKIPLTPQEKKSSLKKHENFYKVVSALIGKIQTKFNSCVVYDIHSYNYKRWDREVPLFNIGTINIDRTKFSDCIENWKEELNKIKLNDIQTTVAENDVFKGEGYLLKFITQNFKNTLVLATEIKKVYCNELNGDSYPKIIRQLQIDLKSAIINNALFFSIKNTNWNKTSVNLLLDNKSLNNQILKVDKELYKLLKDYELLVAVTPVNSESEKLKFFRSHFSVIPDFKYNPIKIKSYDIKQKLLKINVNSIDDVSIRNLYKSFVMSSFDMIDLISSLNTEKFLINSIRYYRRPANKDIENAKYLLSLPDIPGEAKKEPLYSATQAMAFLKREMDRYNLKCNIEFSNKIIAKIMVINSRKTLLIKQSAQFKHKELYALAAHEIGVHLITTVNSHNEKLKIFNIGLPNNTETQEGIAILSEYLSGNLILDRLKKIALRVLAVDYMCNGADFIETFSSIRKKYDLDSNTAWNIVARIYRGGGFTKDFLYLRGFVKLLKFWEEHHDLTPIMIGKTSLEYYNLIEEMIGREMIEPPKYIPEFIVKPNHENNNPIYSYILKGLKS